MIKLKNILKEIEESKPISVIDAVSTFFEKNKKSLQKLAADKNWEEFYQKAYDEFPDVKQDEVAQAMNKCALSSGWLNDSEISEMPTEKELEDAAFGEKKNLGKGIKMGDYDKKMKAPKASPTDLKLEILRKNRK